MKLQLNAAHTIAHEADSLTITTSTTQIWFNALPSSLQACLQALREGSEEEALLDLAVDEGGPEALYRLHEILSALKKHSMLTYASAQVTLVPMSSSFQWPASIPNGPYCLSRFCCLRSERDQWVFETPLSAARVFVNDPSILSELGTLAPGPCQQILLAAKVLVPQGSEAQDTALSAWEFHDLLFHVSSRIGRHDHPLGAKFPFLDQWPHPPVCKPPMSSTRIKLVRPDSEILTPFTEVLERRASIRSAGEMPLSVVQLGEFLFRAARLKAIRQTKTYVGSHRPSPGGGAMHELEIYPVIRSCGGLASGLYHYDPEGHALDQVSADAERLNTLLEQAHHSNGGQVVPQVLFVITARFQRMSWKYRSMSYATTLKNAGALIQTMYLVATAMNLAPCALGCGDADLFSELIGSNYYEETSVAEFMLNSLASP